MEQFFVFTLVRSKKRDMMKIGVLRSISLSSCNFKLGQLDIVKNVISKYFKKQKLQLYLSSYLIYFFTSSVSFSNTQLILVKSMAFLFCLIRAFIIQLFVLTNVNDLFLLCRRSGCQPKCYKKRAWVCRTVSKQVVPDTTTEKLQTCCKTRQNNSFFDIK